MTSSASAAAVLRSHLPGRVLGEATPLAGIDDTDDPAAEHARGPATRTRRPGIGPADLDVVECQDTDAARELLAYEELGLCARGEAARLSPTATTAMTGRLPVNPSGGLLSKGEPLGASALGQVVELDPAAPRDGGATPGRRAPASALAHTVGRGANASVVVLTT